MSTNISSNEQQQTPDPNPPNQPVVTGRQDGGVRLDTIPDPDPDAIQNYSGEISTILNDTNFIRGLRTNFLERVSDKNGFFKELFNCIFVKPLGVKRLDHAPKARISNREYRSIGADVVEFLKKNHTAKFEELCNKSPLYKQYGSVWPECSEKITADIMSLGPQIEKQRQIQAMLGRNTAPTSGQPTNI